MDFNIQMVVAPHYVDVVKYALDKGERKYLYVKHQNHKEHIHFYIKSVKGKSWPSAKQNIANQILRACKKTTTPIFGRDIIIRKHSTTVTEWLAYMKHEDESTSLYGNIAEDYIKEWNKICLNQAKEAKYAQLEKKQTMKHTQPSKLKWHTTKWY